MQVLAAVAPTVLEYLLAAHAEHVPQLGPVAPVLPTQLAKRVLPAAEVENAGQAKQAASTVAPSEAEYLQVQQSVHVSGPVVGLYFPTVYAKQVPPLGPVAPLLHRKLAKRVLPAGEVEIVGQAKQAASKATVKPSLAQNLPVMKSVHAPDPVTVLYLPASLQIPYRHQCDSRNLMCSVHFKLRCNSW
jgi:hypothetical protein